MAGPPPIVVRVVTDTKGLDAGLASTTGKITRTANQLKGIALGIGATIVAAKVLSVFGDAVRLYDDLNDANDVLRVKLGAVADAVIALEDKFTDLGLSNVEAATLAVRVTDLGDAAGVASSKIAELAGPTLAAAGAIEQLKGTDPEATITAILKAATTGSLKPLQQLGVYLSEAEVNARALKDTGKATADALTEDEKATARWELILEKLNPQVQLATNGVKDLGDQQGILSAKWDTLLTKVAPPLEEFLAAIVGFISDMIDMIPSAVAGWEMLRQKLMEIATPIARLVDSMNTFLGQLRDIKNAAGGFPWISPVGTPFWSGFWGGGGPGVEGGNTTVNITTGADPSAVVRALRSYARDNGGARSVFRGVPS